MGTSRPTVIGRMASAFLAFYYLFFVSYPLLWAEGGKRSVSNDNDIRAPLIDHRSPGEISDGEPIEAKITDNKKMANVLLHYRFGNSPFLTKDMKERAGIYAIVIPKEKGINRMDYYIEAFDAAGNVSREGSRTLPLTLTLKKAPCKACKKWFWSVTAALIIGFALVEGVKHEEPPLTFE